MQRHSNCNGFRLVQRSYPWFVATCSNMFHEKLGEMIHVCHKQVFWWTYLFVSACFCDIWKVLEVFEVLDGPDYDADGGLPCRLHSMATIALQQYVRQVLFVFYEIICSFYIYICSFFFSVSLSLSHSVKQHFDETAPLRRFFPDKLLRVVEDCWRRSQLGGLEGCLARHDFQIKAQRHEKK